MTTQIYILRMPALDTHNFVISENVFNWDWYGKVPYNSYNTELTGQMQEEN